jgi:hypothetical protein
LLVESENGPLSEEAVRKVHGVCAELVPPVVNTA